MTEYDLNDIVRQNVISAIEEDRGTGDITSSLIPASTELTAKLIAKESFILAGLPWFNDTFFYLDKSINIEWFFKEGDKIQSGDRLAIINGNARNILIAERTALNFLQMMSGVATKTNLYVSKLKGVAALLDTRKTLPGLRIAQKYAVKCGGGENHRFGLYDAFLIKENHIKATGSITKAIDSAKKMNTSLKIEVEVETLNELKEAIEASPDVVMLDNFDIDGLLEAVKLNKDKRVKLEASGNVTIKNIEKISRTGVDYISVGSITKSVDAVDLSLLIE
jgi:nicotinate-nucleotide pyrophosphorylase (carboxylating)